MATQFGIVHKDVYMTATDIMENEGFQTFCNDLGIKPGYYQAVDCLKGTGRYKNFGLRIKDDIASSIKALTYFPRVIEGVTIKAGTIFGAAPFAALYKKRTGWTIEQGLDNDRKGLYQEAMDCCEGKAPYGTFIINSLIKAAKARSTQKEVA